MPNKVTINAVHEGDMEEFLASCGLKDEIKKDEFLCAGCGRTMTIKEIVRIKTVKPYPTVKLYGDECRMKATEED